MLRAIVCALSSILCLRAGGAVVEGTVAGSGERRLTVVYSDLYAGELRQTVRVTGGRFRAELDLPSLTEVEIADGDRRLARVLLAPEQSLKIDRIDSLPSFSGEAAEVNRLLADYDARMNFGSYTPAYGTADVSKFVLAIDRNMEIERRRMRECLADAPVQLRRWAEAEIVYRNALYVDNYAQRHSTADSASLALLYDETRFPLDTAGRISLDYRRYLSRSVRRMFLSAYDRAADLLRQHNRIDACIAVCDRIASTQPADFRRDLLCAVALNDIAGGFNYYTFARVLERVHDSAFSAGEPLERMDSMRAARGRRADMRRFAASSFDRLLEESYRKVIYVDVWAVWCHPCIKEMKHLRRLEESMAGEPVEFVSLCVRSPYEQWSITVDTPENLAVNYYLDQAGVNVLDDYLRVRSYPRFAVLCNGRIVNEDIQRPSSGELVEGMLREYAGQLRDAGK